jgi:hypothetical protein
VSDRELQDLRRRAQTDPTLEPQLLMARLRAGELTLDQLTCAAALDHDPARIALNLPKPIDPPKLDPTNTWPGPLLRLPPLCVQATVRIALAVGRFTQSCVPDRFGMDAHTESALQAAEDWLVCPCERHLTLSVRAGEECLLRGRPPWSSAAARWVAGVYWTPMNWAGLYEASFTVLTDRRTRTAYEWSEARRHGEPGPRLLKAVLDEVLPWALGSRPEPVLCRVIGRVAAPLLTQTGSQATTIDQTH